MSAFKSTRPVLVGESDNRDQNESSRFYEEGIRGEKSTTNHRCNSIQ